MREEHDLLHRRKIFFELSKTLPHSIAISYEKMIAKVDTCVSEMVEKHEGEINLLCTIPGIDRNSAITIISEMRFYASFSLRRLISTFSKAGSVNHRRIQRPTR